MKYSLSSNLKHAMPDEIKCPYNRLGDIYDFMKEHPDKRYNITYSAETVEDRLIQQLEFVKEVAHDYTISCSNFLVLKQLLKDGYPAYLSYPVSDWETFTNLMSLGVTDIFIDGPIGFQMDKIARAKELSERKFFVRTCPTVSPNASLSSSIGVDSFFIRPEDIYLYDNAIDYFEFYADNEDAEKVLYDIYIRGSFLNEISLLVPHINTQVMNGLISPDFAKHRCNCGQTCKIPGRRCHYCKSHIQFVDKSTEYFKLS